MSPSLRIAAVSAMVLCGAAAAGKPPPSEQRITLKYQGTLREALKQIAEKGGINLVITGELKEPAEVYLKDVSCEEALQTVADAHGLKVTRQGSIWTLRPPSAAEASSAAPAAERSDAIEEDDDGESAAEDSDGDGEVEHRAAPLPDPVADPSGFARYMKQRVERDARDKVMRKFDRRARGKNSMQGTGHLVVEEHQSVEDVVSYGGPVDVKGEVSGDVVAFGGSVHLFPSAEVEGNVVAFGGSITKDEGATIEGEELAFGSEGIGKVVGDTVGKTVPAMVKAKDDHEEKEHDRGHSFAGFLAWFAVLFGAGFLAMMFAPDRMKLLEAELRQNPLRCGLIGMVGGLFGLPTLSVVLAVTVVGIPVIPVLWVLAAIGVLMGSAALANEIGTRLPLVNVRKTQAVVLALGVLAMQLVGLVPVVGVIAWVSVGCLALGAIIRSRFGTRRPLVPEPA